MSKIDYSVDQCAIVVLAAGRSSRMGTAKQLLKYKGESLVHHAAREGLKTLMNPVIVVIGANAEEIKKDMKEMQTSIVENKQWQEGIASSLRCGLTEVRKINDTIDGVIFMVCDQPYITAVLLNQLLETQHKTGMPVVASEYENKRGTPALFHESFFTKLMELEGDTGAGELIRRHKELTATVSFPEGGIDIDTAKDYELLLQKQVRDDR